MTRYKKLYKKVKYFENDFWLMKPKGIINFIADLYKTVKRGDKNKKVQIKIEGHFKELFSCYSATGIIINNIICDIVKEPCNNHDM